MPGIGLEFPQRLAFDAWLRIGAQLSAAASSSAWYLGDWLCYGQAAYAGRYRQAIEHTGLDYQTLRNYAWVAGSYPLSRRRDSLSFGHHAEAAALPPPEQDFWLRKADHHGWSRNHLRREIRASLRERQPCAAITPPARPADQTQPHHPSRHDISITMPSALLESCQQAAARQHLTIEAWAIRTLHHAARRSLKSPRLTIGGAAIT